MDGIFGFFGDPGETIFKEMHDAVSHRVGKAIQKTQTDSFSFGFGKSRDILWKHSPEAGISTQSGITAAICGFFTDQKSPITPTSFISCYKDKGISGVLQLRGSFLAALHDNNTGKSYLIRDAAGQRIIYYAVFGKRLLFSIEPKGVHQVGGFSRQLNFPALVQYLSLSFVPGRDTMLKGLFKLPAGCYLRWKADSAPVLYRYYRFEDTPKEKRSAQDWVLKFRKKFADCTADRIPQQGNVGVFLSGGLDSSIVTAQLANQHEGKLHTFSLHFGSRYPNELKFSSAVAKRYSTEHHVFEVKPKVFLKRLHEIFWCLDDPIGDPITIPNYELGAYARKYVDWIFNGEGGDPCFGGPKNYGMLLLHWYGEEERSRFYQEEAYLKLFKRAYSEIDHIFSSAFSEEVNREKQLYRVLTPFFNASSPAGYLDKLMAMNIKLKGENLILPKVDRMLGANGFYSLSPLFDERMIELSFAMSSNLKLKSGDEKLIMKLAFEKHLPSEVIFRPKEGMRIPLQHWFRGELKSYAKNLFTKEQVARAGIFNYERIRQLLDYDTGELEPRYGMKLWMLLIFEIWRRRVIENEK
uniref:asparagine synthase (glutamine-hydrolyzing) n=1 Tax=Candidatus Kentrum sp. SD TaxID=2126332 RepID=A0A450YM58_9GAMM|nr:MAG: asparagine synthase (glutamine-hydrolysing) [Candidatus Kentron sp. SD]VFK42618.1 MAG: asparagine synthase (glutamine-hydrolysing) [Candidatus Kentron sp. SD]